MTEPESAKPPLWFPDTSSLLSLAVDDGLHAAIQAEIGGERIALLDVVVDELEFLAQGGPVAHLAAKALTRLDWLGGVVDTSNKVDLNDVEAVQSVIAGGRPLKHTREHWAESVILALAGRLPKFACHILTEDYTARVEALQHDCEPYSLHRLLADMWNVGRATAEDAAAWAAALHAADRGRDCTADDFRTRRGLGRVDQP